MSDRIIGYRLADGEAQHSAAPRSFFIPSRNERDRLEPGDYAKLLFELVDPQPGDPSGERMWVQVLGVVDGGYVGALTNTPRAITTISVGDRVDFGLQHVIGTLEDWPLLGKKVFVSRRIQDEDIRPGSLYREDPNDERDSGWRAMVGDETDDEINDASNLLLQDLGYLVDRWPDLRAVFKTDPQNAEWAWVEQESAYVRLPGH